MSYWPSKKIGVAMFFVVVLFIFVFSFGNKDKSAKPESKLSEIINQENIKRFAEKDSDGDGLADWEEALWQTDLNNPDTDGDGTSDGEEVSQNRNPTIAGPDDLLVKKDFPQNRLEDDGGLTHTQKFGRDLFTGYLELKDNTRYKGKESELLYNLLDRNLSEVKDYDKYTSADIRTFSEENLRALKDYGNSIIKNVQEGAVLNEIPVIIAILENERTEDKKKLQEIIDLNKKILQKNIDLPAPNGARDIHLNFINRHNAVIDSLEKISKISEDPLLAVVGIGDYTKFTKEFNEVMVDFRKYFKSKNITFSRNEPGFVFNQ